MTSLSTPGGPHERDRNADPSGSGDDAAMHSRGEANEQVGAGVEGPGGTPDAADIGSAARNPWQIPDNAVADSHQHPSTDAPIIFGDPSPYLAANAPAERHTDGSLSVAGGSAGSAIGSADDLADDLEVTPISAPDEDKGTTGC